MRNAVKKVNSIIDYYQSVVLHVPFADAVRATPDWKTRYAVEGWRRDGFERPLSAYMYESTRHFTTRIDSNVRAVIESRIATFGEHPSGLGRFTRTMFAKDLRRRIEPESTALPEPAVPIAL